MSHKAASRSGPPSDPAASARRLADGLAQLGLIGAGQQRVDPQEPGSQPDERRLVQALTDYLALLVKWNRVYNLTAVRDPEQMRAQHLLDSLAPLPVLRSLVASDNVHPLLVDVGSGAGLPGIPLALAWPQLTVVMVEPVGKKAAFIQQAIAALGLRNARVENKRVEQLTLAQFARHPDLIVSRAFASLADFVVSVAALAGPDTCLCAMKGQRPDDEIAALPPGWTVTGIVEQTVPELDAQRHLVLMKMAAPPVGGATTS